MRAALAALLGLWAAAHAHAASLPLTITLNAASSPAPTAEAPGPSAALFANPPYQCVTNVYVSPAGRDSAAGTAAAPWATIQRADTSAAPGVCVNVQPGTYAAGALLSHGGNAATPTGYVVYRCTALLACKITANGGYGSPTFAINASGSGPNYVMIDGFEMAAATPVAYGVGVIVNNNIGAPKPVLSAHHIWILNNSIHGFGEAGIGTNEADWMFVLHNRVYGNAGVTCDAQGSGIGLVVAKALANYTPTAMDQQWAPFNQVVAWNVTYNNIITGCGTASNPYDTDGNGIIMDTFSGMGVDNVLYTKQTLVNNNVSYNNGGSGVLVFRSSYVTLANNTAYNDYLDPWNQGFPRGEIANQGGTYNTIVNNVAWSIPAANTADPRCQGATYDISPDPCPLMGNVAILSGDNSGITNANNTFTGNVTYGGNPPWGWGPSGNAILAADTAGFSCTANRCNVSPLLVNPAAGNFALQSSSPAINFGKVTPALPASAIDAGACQRALTQCP